MVSFTRPSFLKKTSHKLVRKVQDVLPLLISIDHVKSIRELKPKAGDELLCLTSYSDMYLVENVLVDRLRPHTTILYSI